MPAVVCFDGSHGNCGGNYGLNWCFQLTDESISPTRQRLDKARTLGRVTQHFPNLVNGGIQVVVDVDKGVRPEPFLQFVPGHYLAGMLQQNAKNLKRLAAELQLYSILAQFACTKVNFEIFKSQEPKLAFYFCHR